MVKSASVFRRLSLVGALIALIALSADAAARERRVALVLSGGGAAGAAHVGVIRALEEAGARPDCVAGASMGAIVGGLYAAGLTPDQLEAAVQGVDWLSILDDRPERTQTHPMRRRSRLNRELPLNRLPLRAGEDGARWDGGLVDASNLQLRLRALTSPAVGISDFDALPIPYRAVATDLASGAVVELAEGDLATAMRASMSIPGVFAPVTIDERVLVDGGVANNLPIDVAAALCADRPGDAIIAVSIPPSDPDPRSLTTLTGALGQTMSLFIAKSSRDQLERWRGRYELIVPPVQNIGMLDFDRAQEAMRLGYEAARPIAQEIAARLHAGAPPPALPERAPAEIRTEIDVRELRIVNTSFYKDAVIEQYLDIAPPTVIEIAELDRRLQRLTALKAFDQVTYRLAHAPGGGDVLTVVAEGRASGEIEFRTGGLFEDRFDGRARYAVGGGVGFTGLNDLGLRADVDFAIGSIQALRLELEQPLEPAQRWFLRGAARYGSFPTSFNPTPGQRLAEYRLATGTLGADLIYAPYDYTRLEVGGLYRHTRADLLTGARTLVPGHVEEQVAGPRFAFDADTLDDAYAPTKGYALAAEVFLFAGPLIEEGEARGELRVDALGAYDLTEFGLERVSAQAFLKFTGDLNPDESDIGFSAIGGFQRLSGFERDELLDNVAGVAGARVIADSGLVEQLTGFNAFWGGSVEYGGAFGSFEEVRFDDGYLAGSVFAGIRTRLGPFYLGAGAAEGGSRALYMGFGQRF